MNIIIIPNNLVGYYKKNLSAFEAIEPIEMPNGEHFLMESIITYLQDKTDNSPLKSVRDMCSGIITEFQSYEQREVTDDELQGFTDALAADNLFPYPDRSIRVFLTHKQITEITNSPYKPLIDFALLVPNVVNDRGAIIWLERFGNAAFTDEQVQGVLTAFGALIQVRDE